MNAESRAQRRRIAAFGYFYQEFLRMMLFVLFVSVIDNAAVGIVAHRWRHLPVGRFCHIHGSLVVFLMFVPTFLLALLVFSVIGVIEERIKTSRKTFAANTKAAAYDFKGRRSTAQSASASDEDSA